MVFRMIFLVSTALVSVLDACLLRTHKLFGDLFSGIPIWDCRGHSDFCAFVSGFEALVWVVFHHVLVPVTFLLILFLELLITKYFYENLYIILLFHNNTS